MVDIKPFAETGSKAKQGSQLPALIVSLLFLVGALVVLYFVVAGTPKTASGAAKGLDVRPTPGAVRTDIGGYNAGNQTLPSSIKALAGYHDFFAPDGSPIGPPEGSTDPFR